MKAEFYIKNRARLRERLKHGSLVVIAGYGEMQLKNDCAVLFEQEANYYYLTGVEEPNWWYMTDGLSGKEYLVRPDMSDVKAVFDGSLDSQTAAAISGIKDVIDRDEAMRILRTWAKKHTIVYTTEQPSYLSTAGLQLNGTLSDMKKMLARIFETVHTCNGELARMRSIKQPEEIEAIRRAVAVTRKAFDSAKEILGSARYEYDVEAEMTRQIRASGARGHAYTPIVAAGRNACTLHYVKNNAKLVKKEMLLMDVGANVDGYAADITRTYCLGPTKKRQDNVHEVVREAQQSCVALLEPGLSLADYERHVERIMKDGLEKLGLSIEKYRTYFPHSIGHGIGLDVHESLCSDVFMPGMVVTVEPGIYIPEEGIGVRIEDDILINEKGHENLSRKLSTAMR